MATKKGKVHTSSSVVDVSELRATGFRFTSFTEKPINLAIDPNWWETVFEGKADSKLNQTKLGEILELGSFSSGQLAIKTSPIRIDWEYTIPPERQMQDGSIAFLGPFQESMKDFVDVIRKWIQHPNFIRSRRLALATIVFIPVPSREEGYKILSKYLKSVQIEPNSSDFFYQINRPKPSETGFENLMINRLVKWSVMRSVTVQMSIEGTKQSVGSSIEDFNIRIESDINTAQEYENGFDNKQSILVLDEMIQNASEIVMFGENAR